MSFYLVPTCDRGIVYTYILALIFVCVSVSPSSVITANVPLSSLILLLPPRMNAVGDKCFIIGLF
jgi:hypothetical protein